jgi:hypothetical protein
MGPKLDLMNTFLCIYLFCNAWRLCPQLLENRNIGCTIVNKERKKGQDPKTSDSLFMFKESKLEELEHGKVPFLEIQ